MTAPQKGVVVFQPSMISESIKAEVDKALKQLPTDKKAMAELNVGLTTGVNLVYAYRDPAKGWAVAAYVGSKWSGDLQGGVRVTKTWG